MIVTTEQYSWYKFAQVVGENLEARRIIYDAIRQKKIVMEDLFILSEYEFRELFPMFGEGRLSNIGFQNFQKISTKKELKKVRNFRDEIRIVALTEKEYPKKIKANLGIAAPPILFYFGHQPLLNAPSICILGSEDIDKKEIKLTWQLATYFAKMGYNILSSHSWGVAEHAHKAALKVDGTTTGVIANGFAGFDVRMFIREYGWEINSLFLSPFNPTASMTLKNISQRNQLIAAWSDAVIIVTSFRGKNEIQMDTQAIEIGLFALEKNIPVFIPAPEKLSYVPLGNIELERAGAKEFQNVRSIYQQLSHKPLSLFSE